MAKFYAVVRGRKPGIYTSWEEAEKQVKKFPNSVFKSFSNEIDAIQYLNEHLEEEPKSTDFRDYLEDSNSCVAYIDGSCIKEQKASSGVVMLFGSPITDKDYTKQRNVAGELNSALEAMNVAFNAGFKKLTLFYDYQGIEEIAKGRWKAKDKIMKEYKEEYDRFSQLIEIDFVKVKGHSNDLGNELADSVASCALNMKK